MLNKRPKVSKKSSNLKFELNIFIKTSYTTSIENIRGLFDTATLVLIYIYGIFEIEFLWGNMHWAFEFAIVMYVWILFWDDTEKWS